MIRYRAGAAKSHARLEKYRSACNTGRINHLSSQSIVVKNWLTYKYWGIPFE